MRAAAPVVGAVGIRVGATIAAAEAARHPLDVLVLWDPCRSGRIFLREQAALLALSQGRQARGDGSVKTPGFRYDSVTARDLGALDIAATGGPLATNICLVTRPGRTLDAELEARLAGGGDVHHDVAPGLDELLDADGQLMELPDETIDGLVAWISSVVPSAPAPFDAAPFDRADVPAVVAAGHGPAVVERPVRLGPAGLFGIVTEPEGEPDGDAPATTVVCLNMGRSRHIGPSRMWVDLARRWAAEGLRTFRFDLSGLGESNTRPGQLRDIMYPDEAVADIECVAEALSPDDRARTVVIGVCSGAYHAIRGGVALAAHGVCLVNPPPIPGPAVPRQGYTTPHARHASADRVRRWALDLAGRRLPRAVLARLPDGAWWAMNRFGLRYSVSEDLVRLVDAGSDVILVGSGPELVRMSRGARRSLRRLGRSGRFRTQQVDDLEHSLLGPEDRDRVSDLLFEHVRGRFGAGRSSGPTPGAGPAGAASPAARPASGAQPEDGVSVGVSTSSPHSL